MSVFHTKSSHYKALRTRSKAWTTIRVSTSRPACCGTQVQMGTPVMALSGAGGAAEYLANLFKEHTFRKQYAEYQRMPRKQAKRAEQGQMCKFKQKSEPQMPVTYDTG